MSARPSQSLRELFQRDIEQRTAAFSTRPAEHHALIAKSIQKFTKVGERSIRQLDQQKIQTLERLIEELPTLPRKLKEFGISLLQDLKVREAAPVLLRMLIDDFDVRCSCGVALYLIGGKRIERDLIRIARRELGSSAPNRWILEALIHGLKYPDSKDAEDVLVTIFERTDLPGWLRGDAADGLGSRTSDRRTRLFHRAWIATLHGLSESDIDVQFWSMFAIATMACHYAVDNRKRRNRCFHVALPKLREIATNDHRLAPGFWWPMSGEAEDAIGCIENGCWPDPDAGERWSDTSRRGPWNRK